MQMGLTGKLVVVTGSTAGIGRAIATCFARQGAHVVVNGRSIDSCQAAKERIAKDSGCDAAALYCIPGDVSTKPGTEAFLIAIAAIGQPVEVLVNNVGMFEVKDFFEVDDEKWEEYNQKNLMSGVRLSKVFLKSMLERDSGRILFISSECGLRPLEHMVPYSVSKSSQIALARGLAELTKGSRVTVNSVLPGPTMTDGVRAYMEQFARDKGIETTEEAIKLYFADYEKTSLLQRFIDPEEVGNVCVFLGSQHGSAINGCAQRVEGGIIRHI